MLLRDTYRTKYTFGSKHTISYQIHILTPSSVSSTSKFGAVGGIRTHTVQRLKLLPPTNCATTARMISVPGYQEFTASTVVPSGVSIPSLAIRASFTSQMILSEDGRIERLTLIRGHHTFPR